MTDEQRRFSHRAIRASAGTGKTFALTNLLIGLLAAGEEPSRILATTFTRKAAGEILERVLGRLAGAALDEKECAELSEFVGERGLTCEGCAELLRSFVGQMHRANICTLDSFFIRMARAFALELGLGPGWRIAETGGGDEEERIRGEAIGAMLGADAEGRGGVGGVRGERNLVTLMRLLAKGEVRSSVTAQIDNVVQGMHELYMETEEGAWRTIERRKGLRIEEVRRLIEGLGELKPMLTKKGEPSKNWVRAMGNAIRAANAGDWWEFVSKGIGGKIAEGDYIFSRMEIGAD